MPDHDHITISPDVRGGTPCIGGTRIAAEEIAEWYLGSGADFVLRDWPWLSRSTIIVACWYLATRGSRRWRQRWAYWTVSYGRMFALGQYDEIQLPPRSEAKEGA